MNDLEMLERTMTPSTTIEPTVKDQLIKCISSGQSKKLLSKEMKAEDLDKLINEQLAKLYATYKSRLASSMTKSLGESMIRLCSHAACMVLSLKGTEKKLSNDLTENPFLNCAVRDLSCSLYYRLCAWLSPVSAGIIIGRHYMKNKLKKEDIDGEQPEE